jgi:hypothetical protein
MATRYFLPIDDDGDQTMSALSLRLPASLHKHAKRLAAQEGISVNQLIGTALAEKLAALATEEYLQQRGKRASRRKFDAALAKVPDAAPDPQDSI